MFLGWVRFYITLRCRLCAFCFRGLPPGKGTPPPRAWMGFYINAWIPPAPLWRVRRREVKTMNGHGFAYVCSLILLFASYCI